MGIVITGLFGNVDHGKTTLLQALSGKWADTHSEEVARGITIKIGYASADYFVNNTKKDFSLSLKKGFKKAFTLSFVDTPGHESLIIHALEGAAVIDVAILVIAASDTELFEKCKKYLAAIIANNVPYLIVVQNKIDLVDKNKAMQNYKKINQLLENTNYKNSPIIPSSAQQGININFILESLFEISKKQNIIASQEKNKNFKLDIIHSFDVNRPGTKLKDIKGGVLGGVIRSGNISTNKTIFISPVDEKSISTKVIGVFQGNQVENAFVGGGLASIEIELDPSLTKADQISNTRASSYEIPLKNTIDISNFFSLVDFLPKEIQTESDLKINEVVLVNISTMKVTGTITNLDKNKKNLKIVLGSKFPVEKGDKVIISKRANDQWFLIGFGDCE